METPADIRLLNRYNIDRFVVVFPQKMDHVMMAIDKALASISQSPSPKVRGDPDILVDDTGTDERMEIEMHNIYCTIFNMCEQMANTISQFKNQALTQVSLLQLKRVELVDTTVKHLKEGTARFKEFGEPRPKQLSLGQKDEDADLEEEVPKPKKKSKGRKPTRPDKLKVETQAGIDSQ